MRGTESDPDERALGSITLKGVAPPRLQMGCAVGGVLPASLSETERQVLVRHFAVITPENCMKPALIHPEPERYDFTASDAFVRFASEHSLAVVGHTLVWHKQCPSWFFETDTGRAPRQLVLERLESHIHTVVGRYRGKIRGWDVVNEAITGHGELLRETRWLESIGPDYVERAFEFAHAADPGAELYYNDYDIERPEKRQRTVRLLEHLQASGVRLDGVGIQGHWQLDNVPFSDIAQAIADYRALGLEVMFTELDLDVIGRPDSGADGSAPRTLPVPNPYRDGCPADVLERQAEQYARLFTCFAECADAVTRVTFWGLQDGLSWLNSWPGKRTNHPLLFDRECRPKPAFERVVRALQDSGQR
jgi:endo-1,4-beta-xylanase